MAGLARLFRGRVRSDDQVTYVGGAVVRRIEERPNYAKIERLERELGIGDVEPERPIRRAPAVCLTKNCAGDTDEVRTWSGQLVRRIHTCG